jgi:glycosyltransferase involved in cell wall biosynthesis
MIFYFVMIPQSIRKAGSSARLTESSGLSVIVPVFNEVEAVALTLRELLTHLRSAMAGEDFEILIVDDGSTDATTSVVADVADESVNLIRHPENRGYGAALKTGCKHSRFPWLLIIDADGTYPVAQVRDLLQRRSDNDMVVGARSGDSASGPFARRVVKWMLRILASYLSGRRIPDLNSGFRVYRRAIAQEFEHILPNGFSYTTTLTLAMLSSGYRIEYVQIGYNRRIGFSKIRPFTDTLEFFKLVIRTILYFDPLRVFLPSSFVFFLTAFAVAVGSMLFLERILDATVVILFATGVQLLALGMLADIVNRRQR